MTYTRALVIVVALLLALAGWFTWAITNPQLPRDTLIVRTPLAPVGLFYGQRDD